jgi:hypothetical protein
VKIVLYIEGGGNRKDQQARCREGFRKLLEKAGLLGKLPGIIAGGGRNATFDQFRAAMHGARLDTYPILLVDSEDILSNPHILSWAHLKACDNWDRPDRVEDDQAQLMVTCMETWIMADHVALQSYFGNSINRGRLFSTIELEARDRHAVQDALVAATCKCKRTYQKGDRSFEILAELDPETLKAHLPHFKAFLVVLEKHLNR